MEEENKNKSNDKKVFVIGILITIIFVLISLLVNHSENYANEIEELNKTISSLKQSVSDKDSKLSILLDERNKLAEQIKQLNEKYNVVDETVTSETSNNSNDNSIKTNNSTTTNSYVNEDQSTTVYITNTGSKYHRIGCSYLRKSQHAISKSDAISQGYEACSRCNP